MRSVVAKLIVALTASVVFGAGVVALNTASRKPGKPVPVQSSHKPGGVFSKCGGSHKPGNYGCGTGGTASGGAGGTSASGGAGGGGHAGGGAGGTASGGAGGTASGGAGGTSSSGGAGGGSGGATVAACAISGTGGSGTTYYVCDCQTGADADCAAGNTAASDSNAGTSPSAPWKTWEHARSLFQFLNAGDRIKACEGGSFANTVDDGWYNGNATALSPVAVMSYTPPWASGNEGRPKINTSGQDAISFTHGGPTSHGYRFQHLELIGDGAHTAFFIYGGTNTTADVMLCDLYVHDFSIGFNNAGSNVDGATDDNITLADSVVSNNSGQGYIGCGNSTLIQRTTFRNNGSGAAQLNHNIYLGCESAAGDGSVTDVTVEDCDLYQSTMVSGTCQGTSLVAHGKHTRLTIRRNTIHEDIGAASDTCWGIGVVPGYTHAEFFKNVLIQGNAITNVGNISIAVGACQNCTIENNVVNQFQGFNDAAISDGQDEGAEDIGATGLLARNNSINIDGGIGIRMVGEGTGNSSINNAVRSGGSFTGNGCFSYPAASGYGSIDYNIGNGCTSWEASRTDAIAAWRTACGCDANSANTNPGFASTTSPYNLAAASGSSAIVNAGSPSGYAPTDYTGASRPIGAAADVGAYER